MRGSRYVVVWLGCALCLEMVRGFTIDRSDDDFGAAAPFHLLPPVEESSQSGTLVCTVLRREFSYPIVLLFK